MTSAVEGAGQTGRLGRALTAFLEGPRFSFFSIHTATESCQELQFQGIWPSRLDFAGTRHSTPLFTHV